jgi:hypothetical protein
VVVSGLSIANPGDLSRERIVFRALSDMNLGQFAVFCCHTDEQGQLYAGDLVATYWFSNTQIKKDDVVVLYTKEGKRKEKLLPDAAMSHFYYWGRAETLWHGGTRAVLVYAEQWVATDAQPSEPEEV